MSEYIFDRPGSRNKWLKIMPPPGLMYERVGNTLRAVPAPDDKRRRFEISLGTTDAREADLAAMAYRAAHQQIMLAQPRLRMERIWKLALQPGKHPGPDGGEIIATDSQLIHLDAAGAIVKTEANGGLELDFTGPWPGASSPVGQAIIHRAFMEAPRPEIARKSEADAFLTDYIKDCGADPEGYPIKELNDVWALFRSLVSKQLAKCDKDDGRKLIEVFEQKGNRSGTMRRKLARLVAAVNRAIEERHKYGLPLGYVNPFEGIVPDKDDSAKRTDFEDHEMQAMRDNLHQLAPDDQLLLKLLACTGMRVSEALSIDREYTANGIRHFKVGGHGKSSGALRNVPVPKALAKLPKVKGKLFPRPWAEDRLNDWMHGPCGIPATFTDGAGQEWKKSVHSLRHRAIQIVGDLECPDRIQTALFGHSKTINSRYGSRKGVSLSRLKKWIDKIGF